MKEKDWKEKMKMYFMKKMNLKNIVKNMKIKIFI